jgi:hypothetical protein
MCQVYQLSSWKLPEAFIWNAVNSADFLNFKELINFCKSHGRILSGACCLRLRAEFELLPPPAVHYPKLKLKLKLCYDRRFGRPVCLGIKHPSGTYDQIFITVRQLQACWCGALSLTRERVCRLPDSAVICLLSVCTIYMLQVIIYVYATYARPLSVQAQ